MDQTRLLATVATPTRMTTDDKQLFLDAKMAHDAALYQARHHTNASSAALAAAGEVIASHTAGLRAYIAKLEHQLEFEHGFDVANDRWAEDTLVAGEQVFAVLEQELVEPRPGAVALSKYILLEHQPITITRACARGGAWLPRG